MIPAHLVFGDINGHSDMPLERRAQALPQFWQICHAHKPHATGDSPVSFYDVDNDSLMAGFSGVRTMDSAWEVLLWTLRLHRALLANGVRASFGVGLASGRYAIDWDTLPGFLPQLRTHLYYPDNLDWPNGYVDRRRLIGDPLIASARLLSLAKRANAAIAFAFIPGEHCHYERIEDIQISLRDSGLESAFPLTRERGGLPVRQQEWLEDRRLEPFGLGAGGRVSCKNNAIWDSQ